MGEIYRSASSVVIWLGGFTRSHDSELAMQWIKDFPEKTSGNFDSRLNHFNHWKGASALRAIALLLERDWFKRRWVLQEVAFASRATVQCGLISLPWETFSRALRFFQDFQGKLIEELDRAKVAGVRWSQTARYFSGRKVDYDAPAACGMLLVSNSVLLKDSTNRLIARLHDIEQLIALLPDLEVSDDRDLVYALIPLAKELPGCALGTRLLFNCT
jgi:hypothetical protein